MSDLITLGLIGLALILVWRSPSTSMATALCTVAVVEMAAPAHHVVPWYGTLIFNGQALLVFACVALLVVHIRLGELAAHSVWRTTSVALIMAFLLFSKFDGGVNAEHRVWASALGQFVLIGGIGQIIWRRLHVEGWARYGVTLLAFPIGSAIHSFAAYEWPTLWAMSALAAFYYGLVFLAAIAIAERFWNEGTPEQRIKRSATEIIHGSDHYLLSKQRRKH